MTNDTGAVMSAAGANWQELAIRFPARSGLKHRCATEDGVADARCVYQVVLQARARAVRADSPLVEVLLFSSAKKGLPTELHRSFST